MRAWVALGVLALLSGCAGGGDEQTGGTSDMASTGDWPEPEHTIVAGRLLPDMPQDLAFEVPAGHQRLAVALVLADGPGSVAMNVTGPDGRWDRVSTGPFLYVLPGTSPTATFQLPAPGSWSAEVELTGTSTAQYEVHFCADSAERPGPQTNRACHRDY